MAQRRAAAEKGVTGAESSRMERRVYAIATMDTKGQELAFLADRLRAAGVDVVTVDVGNALEPHGYRRRRPEDGGRLVIRTRCREPLVRQGTTAARPSPR